MRMGLAVLVAALSLSACASITRGTTSQIQIVSDPPGAAARTSIGQTCITPCTITVQRKDEFSVTFELAGYELQSIPVRTTVASAGGAAMAGNLLFGGIIGGAVDASTGATLEHVPNPVLAQLIPIKAAPPPPPTPRRGTMPRRPAGSASAEPR